MFAKVKYKHKGGYYGKNRKRLRKPTVHITNNKSIRISILTTTKQRR